MSLKRQTNQKKYIRLYPKRDSAKALSAGVRAPDFSLKSTPDQTVSLADFRGQPLILAFFPADWSPVCGVQMSYAEHAAVAEESSGTRGSFWVLLDLMIEVQ